MASCPICKSEAKTLDPIGDLSGYDCPTHDKFKVSGTVCSVDKYRNASREEWEAALHKAKARKPGGWPVIQTYDF
jgi:hypothetical protein